MPDLAAIFLDGAPGLINISQAFMNYRISAIKLSVTAWPTTGLPILMYINAADYLTTLLGTPTAQKVRESRWTRFRVCKTDGTPTTLTAYYSVAKIWGPDLATKGDKDFMGATNTAGPNSWTSPSSGPYVQYGFCTLSGAAPTVSSPVVANTSLTVYMKAFGRRLQIT